MVIIIYNIILFGAGASYGSDKTGIPPLGSDLFDALVSFNKRGWGKIPLDLADNFRRDFEGGMKILSKYHPHWMPPLQRAMSAYFFNFIPQPSNLYRKLAQRIVRSNWNGILSTINYERLLELSLIEEGLRPIIARSRTELTEIELCMPHGCCHLFCESVKGSSSMVSFAGSTVTTYGPIKVISNPTKFQLRILNDAFPPVMSYFEPEKKTTSGANFIDNQRRRFLEIVSRASNVGIVGVKVRPRDSHIWDPLAETSARLIYCSGKRGGQEFNVWREKRPENQDIILYGYFADCFVKLCKKLNID
ncbi:hypothetical protein ES702_03564 [subsurface metagenome]